MSGLDTDFDYTVVNSTPQKPVPQMIGENPCWRGMNRGPQDFGLKDEVVSFRSQDGISLKAWWLTAEGTPQGNIAGLQDCTVLHRTPAMVLGHGEGGSLSDCLLQT